MSAAQTTIALLTAAGLGDNAETFTGILYEQSPDELREIVIQLVGSFRGAIRGACAGFDVDGDEILAESIAGLGITWAGGPS